MEGKNFAGGHWETMRVDGEIFYKKLKEGEVAFYEEFFPKVEKLHKFIPEFYSLE